MPMTGDENIIEEITVNGTTVPVVNKVATITGTVNSVTINGNNYTPDTNGLVNLGTISGGEGGTGGEYNVIEGVTFNGTTAPITNKIAAITYTAPTLSKGTTTGSGNAVTDISVSGHTVTLTKGSTFLTSYTETDPTVPAAVKAITATDISNWNNKQAALVSGTNIKTINGNSILGEGNISISGASGGEANVIESVKVNGTALTVTNKAVDITAVPASIVTQDATHRFVSDTEKSAWGNIYYIDDSTSTSTIKDYWNNTVSDYSIITQFDTLVDTSNRVYHCFGLDGADLIFRTVNDEGAPIAGYSIDTANNDIYELSSINYLTSETPLSKGTTTGYGNAVTDISVSGHTITLTKGITFADNSNTVHTDYDETITGRKTFSQYATVTFNGNVITNTLDVGGDITLGQAHIKATQDQGTFNFIVSEDGSTEISLQDVLDSKQSTSNKVTSISSSSTNTQYPSALAVYNYGQTLTSSLTTIYSGSGAPASSLGNNGDIYIKVS